VGRLQQALKYASVSGRRQTNVTGMDGIDSHVLEGYYRGTGKSLIEE
jgi:hypothetical protein